MASSKYFPLDRLPDNPNDLDQVLCGNPPHTIFTYHAASKVWTVQTDGKNDSTWSSTNYKAG